MASITVSDCSIRVNALLEYFDLLWYKCGGGRGARPESPLKPIIGLFRAYSFLCLNNHMAVLCM